jgi:hypothetical protein
MTVFGWERRKGGGNLHHWDVLRESLLVQSCCKQKTAMDAAIGAMISTAKAMAIAPRPSCPA